MFSKTQHPIIARALPFFNRYAGLILFLILYTSIMDRFGGLPSIAWAWRLEIPLLLYLYYYFNRITRKSRIQFAVAAIPILMIYIIYDIHHVLMGRLLRITEMGELKELFLVVPLGVKASILMILGLPTLAVAANLNFRRYPSILVGALPLLALIAVMEKQPNSFLSGFEATQHYVNPYMGDSFNVENNGRVSMALYYEARRINALEKAVAYQGNTAFKQTFCRTSATLCSLPSKRNIHMVVLESFIDPNLFKGVRFSRNPIHPSFEALFRGKEGTVISPVFGGATAQAEFEALCGTPALREISGVEFDMFTGAKTYCLPSLLLSAGYHTMASNAFVPELFNSTHAYQGTGFEKVYYPREYAPSSDTYFSVGEPTGERYLFDGVLLEQNLRFIEKWIKDHPGKPLFNYILTIYGHTPNLINPQLRPTVVKMLGKYRDNQLERAANQIYYRTKSMAEYIRGLLRIDPESMIILVSDHLPPLSLGPSTYNKLKYLGNTKDAIHKVRLYVLENGKPVRYEGIHHYDIPELVLNYLGEENDPAMAAGRKNDLKTCFGTAGFHEQYMSIMAKAMCDDPLFFVQGPDDPKALLK